MPSSSDTKRLSKKERQQLALERRRQQVLEQKRVEKLNDEPLRFEPSNSMDEDLDTITGGGGGHHQQQKEVVSLRELLSRKREEVELNAPKFLSKREREQLELEQRQESERKKLAQAERKRKEGEMDSKKRPLRLKEADVQSKRTRHETKKVVNGRTSKFNFEWRDEDDTKNLGLVQEYGIQPVDVSFNSALLDKGLDDVHWSRKPLSEMKTRDWRIMKEDFEIITRGTNLPNPLRSWTESDIVPDLLKIIQNLGYKEPTPIQRAAIPIALQKRDIIGVAETGSGKTLAFLLPMLSKVLKLARLNEVTKNDGPYGLILVPTRELAQQIEIELNKFLRFLPMIDTVSLVGGKLIERDILDLQNKNIEIVIATPGRLIDCLESHYLVLNQVKFLVLDESDKMIEMNFGEQVEKIKTFMTDGERQNMMFTATLTNEVEKLSREYVKSPAIVNIGSASSRDGVVNERITQRFEFFGKDEENKKVKRLERIVTSHEFKPPIIVFVNYKETGEQLFKHLQSRGVRVTMIHGSKSQDQRELALKQLKDGRADVLVATSVASRGIDINNVSLVVNYQMTKKCDEYIHRIGRTGRAGNYGTSITFLTEDYDKAVYPELKRLLQKSGNKIPSEFKRLEEGLQAIV